MTNPMKSLVCLLLGLGAVGYGFTQMPLSDFDLASFLSRTSRPKSGYTALFIFWGLGAALLYSAHFYFQLHRAKAVDPDVKEFIGRMYE